MRKLFIFDIDNTLVASYGIYDEAYRLTSKQLLGREFIMTHHVDGTPDSGFSKLSNPEILAVRVSELGMAANAVESSAFFKQFDKNAKLAAETGDFVLFPGVKEFLSTLHGEGELIVLTSGSRELQLTVLRRAGILNHFNIEQSFFLGDYSSKREAIERAVLRLPGFEEIVHFGDVSSDMKALKEAQVSITKIAVGVTVAGLTTAEELIAAGVDN